MIAPVRMQIKAKNRRFRFQFLRGPANSSPSFPKSMRMDVMTVEGISLNPNWRDVTLCMAAVTLLTLVSTFRTFLLTLKAEHR